MLDAISAAEVAMLQDQMRLQSVSQNISNMQTPGYKRQVLETQGFDEQLFADISTVAQHMQLSSHQTQGTLVASRRPTELAISGDAFFEVQTDEGVFYTRRGDFHVNEQGELSGPKGEKLLGKGGIIRVDDSVFTIDPSGSLFIDNRKVDQINMVRFAHPDRMIYLGEGIYEAKESPLPAKASDRVLQGYIEQSNVKSTDEMMEMVKTSRHFEASQRVMRTADTLLSTAINQLGEGNV